MALAHGGNNDLASIKVGTLNTLSQNGGARKITFQKVMGQGAGSREQAFGQQEANHMKIFVVVGGKPAGVFQRLGRRIARGAWRYAPNVLFRL